MPKCLNSFLNFGTSFGTLDSFTITNVQIKPHFNICPNMAMGIFKGFLSRALHICSENYLAQEIELLINVFAETGHSFRKSHQKIYEQHYFQKRKSKYRNN